MGLLQAKLEEAAAEVNATTMATQEQVQSPGRDQGDGGGGKMQESYPEEGTQEKAKKAQRKFDARVGALPMRKIVRRPVVKKSWSTVVPVRTGMNGWRRYKPTATDATRTRPRRRWRRGFDINDAEETVWLLQVVERSRLPSTGFFAWVKDEEKGKRPTGLLGD